MDKRLRTKYQYNFFKYLRKGEYGLSNSYIVDVFTQNSIYNKSSDAIGNNRKLKIYYSTPEAGVNEDTGLLLLIAGFGGHATSNVYKKMRDRFSDAYNLVTVQCDYFGYEFMQSSEKVLIPNFDINQLDKIFSANDINEIYKSGKFDSDKFLKLGSKYNISVPVRADLSDESPDNFNDMGLMQAIDNITAVLSIMNILSENGLDFNSKKVMAYGHSHGAYLSYLCNAFAPLLFKLIIDNSAWLHPVYLIDGNRFLVQEMENLNLVIEFDYLAKALIRDPDILRLPYLYSTFENTCRIITYHGSTDSLISSTHKSNFCNGINNCIYNEISQTDVDNIVFKSTNHGLDSDFIELFDYTMKKFSPEFEKDDCIDLIDTVFVTSQNKILINYENVIPELQMHPL